jgi:acyl-CoA thioesterase I
VGLLIRNMPVIMANFKRAGVALLLILTFAACNSEKRASSPSTNPSQSPTTAGSSPEQDGGKLIVAFGDSLTAGYGLPDPSTQSYPALLQKRLDERGYAYRVVNAGVSGDTSAGGARRIEWALKGDVEILILELGGNDALRGQPPSSVKQNLKTIIEAARERNVKVILTGMEALPNLGPEYTSEFRKVFSDLAAEYKLPFLRFFLEGIGGISELNQPDGIHPNVRGTGMVLENVWRVLEPLLAKP